VSYHVCDLGNALSEPDFSMVNRLGPSLPCKSLKPLTGMREVPVANCNNRDFCSASQLRMHCTQGQRSAWPNSRKILTVQKFLMTWSCSV
jgi:hypothetical protein